MSGWDVATRRYVVSGRVQGVGYRAFVARVARSLGLKGGATNLDDGRVEVLASGPEHALARLEAALHEGPRVARVGAVSVEGLDPKALEDGSYDVDF